MALSPFLKWAGGKRWLIEQYRTALSGHSGRYIEPFLGGGAVFFALQPKTAILSDANQRLVETYVALRDEWCAVLDLVRYHHDRHGSEYYYEERKKQYDTQSERAAQFIYLNRACWNGLYRVNKKGDFNVPIGSKDWILSPGDDFEAVSESLQGIELHARDFEESVSAAAPGDLLFLDPPYTVAHNMNGFVKYNETIFSWSDQVRLAASAKAAAARGVIVVMTNADHPSILDLYEGEAEMIAVSRASVISGAVKGRRKTTELLIKMAPQ